MLIHDTVISAANIAGFNFNSIHSSWQECCLKALQTMDTSYLQQLNQNPEWLPGKNNIFNAFSIPLNHVNTVLFGESPYPRPQSANGYAFWDAAVTHLWTPTGLSKPVNRATSLRNFIKMLLIAAGKLTPTQTTQPDIARVDKTHLVQTNHELFNNLLKKGFLLLNATLVLRPGLVRQDAKAWQPFLAYVMAFLIKNRPQTKFLLLGNIANSINKLLAEDACEKIYAQHPYNISFIQNLDIINFFKPLNLLAKK